jgi:hypothetical protein
MVGRIIKGGFTMAQVQETSNYEKFELLDFNRDVGKTKQLELSMKKFGFRTCEPLDVMKNGFTMANVDSPIVFFA